MTDNQKLAIIRGAVAKLQEVERELNIGDMNAALLANAEQLISVRDQLTYLIGEL